MIRKLLGTAICLALVFSVCEAVADPVANPVVPNATLKLRHGQFPVVLRGQKWTHVGVDLAADAGSPVYAFADGTVTEVITDGDKRYRWAGNAVMIRHRTSPKEMFTIYLHLESTPGVRPGEDVRGGKTIIGRVGATGSASGPHVHFEIRHFSEWVHPEWQNIYGPGDQRTSRIFAESWMDPEAAFRAHRSGLFVDRSGQMPEPAPRHVRSRQHEGAPDLSVEVGPKLVYDLFVPVARRLPDSGRRILGVASKRDMWLRVRIFQRQRHGPWKEVLEPDSIVLAPAPSGEAVREFRVDEEGEEIRFEVSNDLNDRRILAHWIADFTVRALLGRPLQWGDPQLPVEALAFLTNFVSPSAAHFGIGMGIGSMVVTNPGETITRMSKALVESDAMRDALERLLRAGGVAISGASLASVAAIAATKAAINAAAWTAFYRNTTAEPFIEEVIFRVRAREFVASPRQQPAIAGTRAIYQLTFVDERRQQLSEGQYVAVSEGTSTFAGLTATRYRVFVTLNPPISGWERFYRDPVASGGRYRVQSEQEVIGLGGWSTGRVTTEWRLDPPIRIDLTALNQRGVLHYTGTIEYSDGTTKRHAPTTIRVDGLRRTTVPAGTFTASRVSLHAVNVQDYGTVIQEYWQTPERLIIRMNERSPGLYWWEAVLQEVSPQ